MCNDHVLDREMPVLSSDSNNEEFDLDVNDDGCTPVGLNQENVVDYGLKNSIGNEKGGFCG